MHEKKFFTILTKIIDLVDYFFHIEKKGKLKNQNFFEESSFELRIK